MSRRALAVLSLLSAAVLLPVTACTADNSEAQQPVRSSEPSSETVTEAPVTESASPQPSVEQPPELDKNETVAARQSKTQGNRSIEFDEGEKGDALIVAVRCQGKGTIEVTVRPVSVSFQLECLGDEVSTTYNQVAVAGVEDKGTVSVEAPSTVRWSMTIGRGEAAAEETPGTDGV